MPSWDFFSEVWVKIFEKFFITLSNLYASLEDSIVLLVSFIIDLLLPTIQWKNKSSNCIWLEQVKILQNDFLIEAKKN